MPGPPEITEIRRQQADWQRDATRHLATGRTGEAIGAYAEHSMVHAEATREGAREQLVTRWDSDRQTDPAASRIILTHTNDEVRALRGEADRMGPALGAGGPRDERDSAREGTGG